METGRESDREIRMSSCASVSRDPARSTSQTMDDAMKSEDDSVLDIREEGLTNLLLVSWTSEQKRECKTQVRNSMWRLYFSKH
jgi:hypothetical protein